MGKFLFFFALMAITGGVYVYFNRKSSDSMRDQFMEAASTAREKAANAFDRAQDAVKV